MDRYYMLYQIFQLRQAQEQRDSLPVAADLTTPTVNQEAQAVNNELNSATNQLSEPSGIPAFAMYPGLAPVADGVAAWQYPVPYTQMDDLVAYEVVPMAGYRYGL